MDDALPSDQAKGSTLATGRDLPEKPTQCPSTSLSDKLSLGSPHVPLSEGGESDTLPSPFRAAEKEIDSDAEYVSGPVLKIHFQIDLKNTFFGPPDF